MTLNVDKNKDALVEAWREVMDEKVAINWALFGYDGLSYDLNLVSKGDGGVEELIEDFNSGKIMYALCRVKIKEKNVEKIALINWQGEGAPLSRKGTCANHVADVKNFFKGVHVTINARTDEDVEPEVILQTVAKATAGDGVKHSMSSDIDSQGIIGPIGTVYKKVNPMDDINSAAKDEFWRKEEQEEERRKREEQNKLRKFSQNEVKLLRRESQDYFNEPEKITSQSINKVTSANTTNQTNGSNNLSSAAAIKASTPTKSSISGSSGDLVRQRIKSFDHGTPTSPMYYNNTNSSNASNGVNGTSNGNGSSESLSVLKRRQLFESGAMTNSYTAPVKKNPAQEIKLAQEKAQKEQQQQKQSDRKTNVSPVVNVDKVESVTPIEKYSSPPLPTSPPPSEPIQKSISPASNDSAQTVVLTESVKSDNSNGYANGSTNNVEDVFIDDSVQSGEYVQENLDIVPDSERENVATPTLDILPEMGICARALYDYQAADDSEITFDPGEIITNIEQIDEGWWEGMGPRGVYGLFPANYVELLN